MVKAGQVYADCDKRRPKRTLKVKKIDGNYVLAITSKERMAIIRKDRLHEFSRGYKLVTKKKK